MLRCARSSILTMATEIFVPVQIIALRYFSINFDSQNADDPKQFRQISEKTEPNHVNSHMKTIQIFINITRFLHPFPFSKCKRSNAILNIFTRIQLPESCERKYENGYYSAIKLLTRSASSLQFHPPSFRVFVLRQPQGLKGASGPRVVVVVVLARVKRIGERNTKRLAARFETATKIHGSSRCNENKFTAECRRGISGVVPILKTKALARVPLRKREPSAGLTIVESGNEWRRAVTV